MRTLIVLFFIIILSVTGIAQNPIRYEVNLDNIHHHELRITIEFSFLPMKTLSLRMADTSPGRYAEHGFAKNVYGELAVDEKNNPLPIYRMGTRLWNIPAHNGYVKFSYTLYGNYADGTYSGFDSRKVHMNMPSTFIYGSGMDGRPIEITFDLTGHPDWNVATQLEQKEKQTFRAPDYYYFFDSPTIIGDIDFRSWEVKSPGKTSKIEVAMLHEGTNEELDAYVETIKKVVEEQKHIYGELPDFDFGRYTFLCSYNPWVIGDAMEHRNSTVCTSTASLKQSADQLINSVSHEFLHCWNVERLRPASLEPFNFDEANLSGELWFGEGFTNYYDALTLCRAGINTPKEYVEGMAWKFNSVLNSPGRALRSPVEMSYNAPFVDDASFNDETNFENTFISYYTYGDVLGCGLDLLLRTQFENLTLDDYMKYLWDHFGKPEIPYEIPDLQQALADLTNDPAFAKMYFDHYIYKGGLPDFQALFADFGIEMALEHPGKVQFGNYLRFRDGAYVGDQTIKGHPFYEAGLEKGDNVLNIAGTAVTNDSIFTAIKKGLIIGKTYDIQFEQLGIKRKGRFTAQQDPTIKFTWLPDKIIGKKERILRAAWLKIN